jgi:signal transduction histidine kinase
MISSLSANGLQSNFRSKTIWILGKDKDNHEFPCHLRFRTIIDALGKLTGFNISFIDEREYNQQIEQLQKDQDRLKMIEKMKDEFVAVASHELRTPIQPILGFAMLAKRGIMSEEKAWEGVLREARRLQQLANDILDVTRIEAGGVNYAFGKLRINELLCSIVDSYRLDLQPEICLNVIHDDSEIDFEIEADRARITQVVANLISNSIKFTEKGGIRVESRVLRESNEFEIRVVDNGRGLSEEILPVLFEKFATKGHGNVANNKGTGLGLYITKSIVEAHKGQISAFNNSDSGATFLVRLPISQSS